MRQPTGTEFPATDRHAPGTRVEVRLPGDQYTRQIGTVTRTYADAGDMVHRVQFADGRKADYVVTELVALT